MNQAAKAALFNALLFPGLGHIYLKKYKRGIVFMTSVLTGMMFICWSVLQTAISILKETPLQNGTLDGALIAKMSMDAARSMTTAHFIWILPGIVLLWMLSIIDAYKIGKNE